MKKTLTLLTAICLMFSLAACDKSNENGEVGSDGNDTNGSTIDSGGEMRDNDTSKISVSDIKQTKNEFEEIKNTKYDNLNLESCSLILPETGNSIPKLKITTSADITLEPDFDIANFLSKVNEEHKDFFGVEADFKKDFYCDANAYNASISVDPIVNWADFSSCENGIKNKSTKFSWVAKVDLDNNLYAWWGANNLVFPYRFTKGEGLSYSEDENSNVMSWLPIDTFELKETFLNDGNHSDEKYNLLDGEKTIGDAVNFYENEYLNKLNIESDFSLSVAEIKVYEIEKDKFGYNFISRPEFSGIPFDYMYNNTHHSSASDGKNYIPSLSEAFMLRSNDIDTFTDLGINRKYEKTGELDKIINLTNAVKTASEFLTPNVKFDVKKIELIYTLAYNGTENEYAFAVPEWKISAYNSNDGFLYNVYVNAETAETNNIIIQSEF
jgi:hypothetical protein